MTSVASRVYEYVQDRRYVGELLEPTAVGRSSMDGQPPHTTFHLRIERGAVTEGRFRTSGCGYLIACCGALIELVHSRSLAECGQITEDQLAEYLRGLPEPRRYCARLALAALHDALRDASSRGTCPME
jgi:NifU-like protein involved in Fe-S cluster formation